MNEIVNTFLSSGDKFIPETHLRQPAVLNKPGFTDSPCERFTKNQKRIQKSKET